MADAARVAVVGVCGDGLDALSSEAARALGDAQVVAGGKRLLDAFARWRSTRPDAVATPATETVEIGADAAVAAAAVRRASDDGARVCVLASGDPGFFGIVRALLTTMDRRMLRVLPAVSSVALAFARLGLPWDDAAVVSAHGRPLADAVAAARTARKCAVLTSPQSPPHALGAALLEQGATFELVAVCTKLGSSSEAVREVTLEQLASGRFDPFSVVVLARSAAAGHADKVLAWGLPEHRFAHRGDMITKAEVRAVCIAKLALPARGVCWDVGAGSGSVAVECAGLRPGLEVFAIERRLATSARIEANAAAHGAAVSVVTGEAPDALAALPPPDRA
ncbi:MAG: precorrin-6y C5,15-methyltransferase (decarboxylating) subunit CbiE, partial [Acidimicrobiales bacterium]